MISVEEWCDFISKVYFYDMAFQGFASTRFTYFSDESPYASPQLLHAAALKGDLDLLKTALDYNIPVDVKDEVIYKFKSYSIW